MASACEKCGYFPVRCKCGELQLQAENKRLKDFVLKLVEKEDLEELDYWAEEYLHAYEQLAKIQEIQAENKELKQNLLEFGRHSEGCSRTFGEKYRCKCGWAEARAGSII